MRKFSVVCLWAALVAPQLSGQTAYRPAADTTFILLVNPYRMYWVRGTDTLSQPQHAVSVEAQRWEKAEPQLRVIVQQWGLDVHRRTSKDTFLVAAQGAVVKINGHPPGLNERVDLLLQLPKATLAPGLAWADTLRSSKGSGPGGDGLYEVTRTYHVDQFVDSNGTTFAHVSARGLVHYRDSWWVDSAAGAFASLDVSGPVTERFLFAVRAGRLVERSWSMNLTGRGSLPGDSGRVDTTAAGLISAETQRIISSERAHLLTRALPGRDTSVSLDQGPILLHTVLRQPQDVESGMARNDGLVGTTRAHFVDGRVASFEALWTDTADTPRRIAISLVHDSLRVRDAGQPDTMVAIPAVWWGVADYAMAELLVPVFLSRTPDSVAAPFAIFRPYARHWDVGLAMLRQLGENFVASYRLGTDTARTLFLITKDGDLLMGQNSDPTGAERMPAEGSARRARLEAILQSLQNHSQ